MIQIDATNNPDSKLKSCRFCNNQRIEVYPDTFFIRAKLCSHCLTPCPLCNGDGYVREEDENFYLYQTPCECKQATHLVQLWEQARIPSRFFNASFTTFNQQVSKSIKHAFTTAMTFVSDNHFDIDSPMQKGLLFLGDVGTGKTFLACCILKELISKYHIPSLFQEFSSLIRRIKAEYDKGLYETDIINQLTSVPVLVIDELGKGRLNEWELQILDTLISERYNANKLTIATTNYQELEQVQKATTNLEMNTENSNDYYFRSLGDRITSRVYSRLKEMCDFVYMQGEDFRKREG